MWHKDTYTNENIRAVATCEEKMKSQSTRREPMGVTIFLKEKKEQTKFEN